MNSRTMPLLAMAVVAALTGVDVRVAAAGDSFESMRLERLDRDRDREPPIRYEDRERASDDGRREEVVRERRVVRRREVVRETAREVVPRQASGWTVLAGRDLRSTLSDWCSRQGWTLAWTSDYTYEMTTSATFSGTFEDAVKALMVSMRDARPTPTVEMYEPNHVLKVANQGSSVTD